VEIRPANEHERREKKEKVEKVERVERAVNAERIEKIKSTAGSSMSRDNSSLCFASIFWHSSLKGWWPSLMLNIFKDCGYCVRAI